MMKKIENLFFEHILPGMLMSVLIVIFGMLVIILYNVPKNNRRYERMFQQCLKDHKEYECENLLNKKSSSRTANPIPIIIPR